MEESLFKNILNHSFIHSSILPSSFINSFIHPSICSFVRSFVHPSIHPSNHWLVRSFVHSFIHLLTRWSVQNLNLTVFIWLPDIEHSTLMSEMSHTIISEHRMSTIIRKIWITKHSWTNSKTISCAKQVSCSVIIAYCPKATKKRNTQFFS